MIRLPQISLKITRSLYSASTLGIDTYNVTREKVKQQFVNTSEKFKEKMKEVTENNQTSMIFTEDLKNMIHLAESPEDIQLVMKMITKFNNQNKELRFGNFVFGPVVLRMFYFLNDAESALKCFKDSHMEGFFDQLITFQILMDMLYEKKRYTDVLDVFNIVKSRQIQSAKYPKHAIVLVFAACYKMNTPESFDFAKNLWKELNAVGHNPMRKAGTFAAGLALLQNSPHIALEILSTIRDQHYLTVRNLKALAFAEIGRPEDALPILRSVLEIDDPINKKRTFIRSVVDKVKESILRLEKKDLESDFRRIEAFLADHGHITEETMEDILCTEIISTAVSTQRKQRSFLEATFDRDKREQSKVVYRDKPRVREGLHDLY